MKSFILPHLENSDCCPQKRIKVFPIADSGVRITKLAAKQIHAKDAEDEDEECQQPEEDSNIVHGLEHHDQLSPQIGEKSDQL